MALSTGPMGFESVTLLSFVADAILAAGASASSIGLHRPTAESGASMQAQSRLKLRGIFARQQRNASTQPSQMRSKQKEAEEKEKSDAKKFHTLSAA